jgi:hypothetical protein
MVPHYVKRMQATMRENLHWPGIDAAIKIMVQQCPLCQWYKITAVKQYGKIPLPKSKTVLPWKEVHMDMIGLWQVKYNSSNTPRKTTT